MRLYLTEKFSVASEVSKCLPNAARKRGYFQTDAGIVTWAVGHMLEQAEPEVYDAKYKKWRLEDLPIIPKEWQLLVVPHCKDQFEIVKTLIEGATEIVHTGDPDSQGQLLIDEILWYLNNKKPVYRLLLNALDEKTIRQALHDLRNNKDFYTLGQSALARSRADWLFGYPRNKFIRVKKRQPA